MTKPLGKGTYGPHGRSVRLWIEGDLIRAQWRVRTKRTTRSWPNTATNRAEAKAWAATFAEARTTRAATLLLTTGVMWERYSAAEFPTLRARTQRLYRDYWTKWSDYVRPDSIAEDLGPETMAAFRGFLDRPAPGKKGLAPATIGQTIRTVKTVYGWARRHRLITRDEIRDFRYKVAKDKRAESPDEYTAVEAKALLDELALDGERKSRNWRAGAVLRICALQGARQGAVLHLTWDDVDLEAGVIHWRAAWDKVGREWSQPLRAPTRAVLDLIRHRTSGKGWIFPAAKKAGEVYPIQSLWLALRKAETAAGVPHRPRRAGHGLRRMVFHDVIEAGGDIADAMASIGDTDLRVASKYLKTRHGKLAAVYDRMDRNDIQTAREPEMRGDGDGAT